MGVRDVCVCVGVGVGCGRRRKHGCGCERWCENASNEVKKLELDVSALGCVWASVIFKTGK